MSDYSVDPGATIERLIAERDAALLQLQTITADRDAEKLMKAKARIQRDVQTAKAKDLQQRLTAADERGAELLIMLRMAWVDTEVSGENCRRIDAALKSVEVSKDEAI